jgi:hypothetical protein
MIPIDMTAQFAPILGGLQALLVVSAAAIVADAAGFFRRRRRSRPSAMTLVRPAAGAAR